MEPDMQKQQMKRATFGIVAEYVHQIPREVIQQRVAREAGAIVTDILLDTGIAKGSPIYVDASQPKFNPIKYRVEIDIEVKFYPPEVAPPARAALESPVAKSAAKIGHDIHKRLEAHHAKQRRNERFTTQLRKELEQ